MKEINTKNLKIYSEEKNSTSYISEDGMYITKFSNIENTDNIENVERTKFLNEYLIKNKINTPKIRDIVKDEKGRIGLESEYKKDKTSLSRLISKDTTKIEECMGIMVDFGKKLHNIECKESKILQVEDLIDIGFKKHPDIYTENRIKNAKKYRDKIKKIDNILHMDFQPGNYIKTNTGENYMIDIETLSKGNEIYDIAFFYFLYNMVPDDAILDITKNDRKTAKLIWRTFVKKYFNFSSEKEIDEYETYIKPYSILAAVAQDYYIPVKRINKLINEIYDRYIME